MQCELSVRVHTVHAERACPECAEMCMERAENMYAVCIEHAWSMQKDMCSACRVCVQSAQGHHAQSTQREHTRNVWRKHAGRAYTEHARGHARSMWKEQLGASRKSMYKGYKRACTRVFRQSMRTVCRDYAFSM